MITLENNNKKDFNAWIDKVENSKIIDVFEYIGNGISGNYIELCSVDFTAFIAFNYDESLPSGVRFYIDDTLEFEREYDITEYTNLSKLKTALVDWCKLAKAGKLSKETEQLALDQQKRHNEIEEWCKQEEEEMMDLLEYFEDACIED